MIDSLLDFATRIGLVDLVDTIGPIGIVLVILWIFIIVNSIWYSYWNNRLYKARMRRIRLREEEYGGYKR